MYVFFVFLTVLSSTKIDQFKRILTAILQMQQRGDCYFLSFHIRNLKSSMARDDAEITS